ncbi:NADH dehydrogenase [ubiquinone] 1 alpha subcomplex assembly factor 3 isoform X2 [Nannospalax galili]|uniref:NADH dehydrogenase [ubiquinone] 1 alpha subcomplex assembly factor 3 isoform X2 n=1 Tax=Nannospalax galili TaxID=1026970 RepID=UPI00111BD2BA|nr:NADH dehydrogenase [ubiquinone] 1 alpha subcomplex assembly factor 3 isoform X2 [Nannospalax galili]
MPEPRAAPATLAPLGPRLGSRQGEGDSRAAHAERERAGRCSRRCLLHVWSGSARLRGALRDAGGAVATRGQAPLPSHQPCDPITTRPATMAGALAFRCLYRARPAPHNPHVDRLCRAPRRGHRLSPVDDELYQRTHISLLQREGHQTMYIDSYNSRGFTVNGNRVLGPCALLPHSVVQWNVSPTSQWDPTRISLKRASLFSGCWSPG